MARVIDSGYAVLDSPPADAGLAPPNRRPTGGDGSCGSEGGRPRHAECPQTNRIRCPVLFGSNDRAEISCDIDAFHTATASS